MMQLYGLVIAYTENLGDDIQSLAALQYLPFVNFFLDRDRPYVKGVSGKAIFNGWYTHEPFQWLPPPNVEPLFISLHLADFAYPILLSRSVVRRVFMRFGHVGARDLFTLGVLKTYGIASYFSGCLTLTLDYGFKSLKAKGRYILIDDVIGGLFTSDKSNIRFATQAYHKTPMDYIRLLPGFVRRPLRDIIPYALIDNVNYRLQRILARRYDVASRLVKAMRRVAEIAGASLVVTSRLHVALPALAFDVPVVFVHENLRDPRFWGLTDFMNVYTPKRFRDLMEGGRLDPKDFGIPKYERLQELKTQLVERVKEFVREE